MDAQIGNQTDFVDRRLAERIAFFRGKRNYNRRVTSLFVVCAASLSAVATVALGAAKMTAAPWLEVVALVASGLATVVGALQALLAHRNLWQINNTALAALHKLQLDFDYRRADPSPVEKVEVDQFYGRFSNILEETDRAWIDTYAVK